MQALTLTPDPNFIEFISFLHHEYVLELPVAIEDPDNVKFYPVDIVNELP